MALSNNAVQILLSNNRLKKDTDLYTELETYQYYGKGVATRDGVNTQGQNLKKVLIQRGYKVD